MKQIYFLCGGGGNRYDAADLVSYLSREVTFIELPGHGLEKETKIENLEDLAAWFSQKIDHHSDCVLIAHSMGANLAPYLALQFPAIKQLILLDGGYYDFDSLLSLEDEIAGTKAYFEQMTFDHPDDFVQICQADAPYWSENLNKSARESLSFIDGHYRLHLAEDTFLTLLSLQRACQGLLSDVSCPTVLIPQTLDCPDWKQSMLDSVPSHITIDSQLACSHSPHTECPEQLAALLKNYL